MRIAHLALSHRLRNFNHLHISYQTTFLPSFELPKESGFVVPREEPYIFIPYTELKREVKVENTNDTSHLLFDNCTSGGETSSCQISEEVDSVAVEETTSVSRQAAKNTIEKENISCPSHELLKECSFAMPHLEQYPIIPNNEIKHEVDMKETSYASLHSSTDKDTAGEGISHNHISREVNVTSVDGTTTIQSIPEESFSEKERTFPAGAAKVNSGLKHRVQKKEVRKMNKEHRLKKRSKELPMKSCFVLSHEQPSPVASTIDKDTAGEGISHNHISREVNVTSVDGTTTIQSIPEESFSEKEGAFPAGTEKANSGLKHKVQKKEGKKNSKEHKVKKDSKGLPINSCFVLSHEQPSSIVATIEQDECIEGEDVCDKMTNVYFAKDNCTSDTKVNKEVNLSVDEEDTFYVMILKKVKAVVEAICKIKKEKDLTPVEEVDTSYCMIMKEVKIVIEEAICKIKKERGLTPVEEKTSFCMIIKEVKAVVEEAICKIKKEKDLTPVEEENTSYCRIMKEVEAIFEAAIRKITKEKDLTLVEEETSIPSQDPSNCTSVEKTASYKIKTNVNLAAVEGISLIPIQPPKNTIEEGNVSNASNVTCNELSHDSSFVMTHEEPYNFIANYEDVGIQDEMIEITDTTLHSFAPDNCTSGKTSSVNINKGVNIAAVEETSSIPMTAPKNIIEKGKYLSNDSNEHQEKSSFVISRGEPSSVSDNFGKYD
ncbi:hypothetical protein TNCV_3822151 [Trichonephila clavipes]|nr:hypothetical protein TNCV_3822151 [Trichonephila clavipes]